MRLTCGTCCFFGECGTTPVDDKCACGGYTPANDELFNTYEMIEVYKERRDEFRKYWFKYIEQNIDNFF